MTEASTKAEVAPGRDGAMDVSGRQDQLQRTSASATRQAWWQHRKGQNGAATLVPYVQAFPAQFADFTCQHEGCYGGALEEDDCFTHSSDSKQREIIEACVRSESALDLSGCLVDQGVIDLLSTVVSPQRNEVMVEFPVNFANCHFPDIVDFSGIKFTRDVSFKRTTWAEPADFSGANFRGRADFAFAVFDQESDFRKTVFGDQAIFSKARFGAGFPITPFGTTAQTHFGDVEFHGPTFFGGAFFAGAADFPGAIFEGEVKLGPMVVAGQFLSLSRATIKSHSSVEASAKLAWLDRITAEKEVSFRLRFAEVSMCDATLADDTYIEHLPGHRLRNELSEHAIVEARRAADPDREVTESLPRILTLAGTPLSKVIIRGVDLRACRFTKARDLPSLTIDGPVVLPRAPRTGRLMILDEFLWRSEKKPNRRRPRGALVLAEERLIAANRADSATWSESLNNLRNVLPKPEHEHVESTYRTLRKSLEDRGDKPGADDFYYGEMQMRRWTPRSQPFLAWATKKIILWLYWLVAGYGHRASRAALCLGVLAVLGGLLLVLTAAAPDHSLGFGEAVFDSIQLCISPLTRADPGLRYSGWGQLVRLSLLILGPAIAAVMVFALHARIRR